MRIVLISLNMSHNLGEHLVIQCSEYLFRRIAPDEAFEFVECDLYGRVQRTAGHYTPGKNPAFGCSRDLSPMEKLFRRVVQKARRTVRGQAAHDLISRLEWKTDPNYARRVRACFREKIQGADLVMFAGGGIIEYCYNRYQDAIELIVAEARRQGKPVVFGSVGLVGECDPKSFRFRTMRRALLSPNVKLITVRDHVGAMNEIYLRGEKTARLVADSAVWAAEALGVKADPKGVIGVGLVRENAFESYRRAIPYDSLFDLYRALLAELTARGHAWRLFGNGFESDQEFGEKLVEALNLDPNLLVPRPAQSRALLETIAGYQAIVTFRLHSCISAYSLGVPSVVLSWNDKVDDFMATIGFPDRALSGDRASAKGIVDQMERAIADRYDESARSAYRGSVEDAVREAYQAGGGV